MNTEIKKKYVIEMYDEDYLIGLDNLVVKNITQTYLKSDIGEEKCVRRIISTNNQDNIPIETFAYTTKRTITNLSIDEFEKNISINEYERLIEEEDTNLGVIHKKRVSFPYENNIIEIDIYPFWNDICIMEINPQDKKISPKIPDFIKVIEDVTSNKKYSNYSIATQLVYSKTPLLSQKHFINDVEENECLEEFFNARIEDYGFKYPISIGTAHIHNRDSLSDSQDFITLYDSYGLKKSNHHKIPISVEKKETIAKAFFDEYRTLFQREEERIISTEAFRRLQYKTQVMVNSTSDDQRTRLLHSLEVEKISRKIALALKANCELTQAIAIGHDIGHTPFGHAGEKAICKYLENRLSGAFSHAVQSVKVIDYLCSHRTLKPLGIRGLGISTLVLEGILKHDTDSFSDDVSNPAFRLQYNCEELLVPIGYENSDQHQKMSVLIGGVESQIVCWADKIAYLSHDWEEFVSIGFLEKMLNRVNTIIIQMTYMCDDQYIEEVPICCDLDNEKNSIRNIIQNISNLNSIYNKETSYSVNITENKQCFIEALQYIDEILAITGKHKGFRDDITFGDHTENQNNYYFSSEQYQTLYSFFSITRSWVSITELYPEKIGNKMDAIFTFYNYLCKLLPHTTTPALINQLIKTSKLNLKGKTRTDVIRESNNKRMFVDPGNKDNIKKAYLINFDEKVFNAVKQVGDFIKVEYNHSTRIENMNCTAEQILNTLFNFYFSNPQMLPLKQRNKIEQEISVEELREKDGDSLSNKLMDYYWFKLCSNENTETLIDRLIPKIRYEDPNIDEKKIIEILSNLRLKEDFLQHFNITKTTIKETIILRVIADYIAGMTDRMAELKYNEVVSSSSQWCQEYTERSTFSVY